MEPEDRESSLRRIRDLEAGHAYAEAAAGWEGLLARFPQDAALHLEAAGFFEARAQPPRAAALYRRALDLGLEGNDRRDALVGLGNALTLAGDLGPAVDVLRRAGRDYPGDPVVTAFLALALLAAGSGPEAVSLLGVALVRESPHPGIRRYSRSLRDRFRALNGAGEVS